MTTVSITEKGNRITVDVKGHAGFNPGNDIVCSAISMITYTLVQNLLDLTNEGLLDYCKTKEDEGRMTIKIKMNSKGKALALTVIKVLKTGYELLENQYPDNVSFQK